MVQEKHENGARAGRARAPLFLKKTGGESLLGFLLLLLTDADLEVELSGFLERFVIVPANRVRQVSIDVSFLRKHRHQREIVLAFRTEGPEALNVRNCHTLLS